MTSWKSAVAAATLCTLMVLPAWATPVIQLIPDVWNIDEISQWQTRTFAVQIKNAGDAPLVISNVRDGCSACTRSVLPQEKRVIQPGQSVPMSVTFFAKRMMGDVTKTVRIVSNDPKTPQKLLTVMAKVKQVPLPRLQVGTRILDFGVLPTGATRQLPLKVTNSGQADLTIGSFNTSRHVKAKIEGGKLIPAGQSRQVTITVGPFDKKGVVRLEYCQVRSDDPKTTGATVQVTGYVADEAALSGLSLRPRGEAAAGPGGKGKQYRNYEITNTLGVPVTISLDGSPKTLGLKLGKTRLAPGESTILKIDPDVDAGTLAKDTLKIGFDVPLTVAP